MHAASHHCRSLSSLERAKQNANSHNAPKGPGPGNRYHRDELNTHGSSG